MKSNIWTKIKKIFNIFTRYISYVCIVLLVGIGLFLVYNFIMSKVYEKRGQDYQSYISLFTIISPSMHPTLKVYDVAITIRQDDLTKLKEGDIITFYSTSDYSYGLTVTHRIIQIVNTPRGPEFYTKGDNNGGADGAPVLATNVIGKVVMNIPQLGRIQFFLASRFGWIFAILIPALGVIIYDLLKIFKVVNVNKQTSSILYKQISFKKGKKVAPGNNISEDLLLPKKKNDIDNDLPKKKNEVLLDLPVKISKQNSEEIEEEYYDKSFR